MLGVSAGSQVLGASPFFGMVLMVGTWGFFHDQRKKQGCDIYLFILLILFVSLILDYLRWSHFDFLHRTTSFFLLYGKYFGIHSLVLSSIQVLFRQKLGDRASILSFFSFFNFVQVNNFERCNWHMSIKASLVVLFFKVFFYVKIY